jgi:hypothetical protein
MSNAPIRRVKLLAEARPEPDKMAITLDPSSDVFHNDARLKWDLAAIVRYLIHIAERHNEAIATEEYRRVRAPLAENRFNLAIVNHFTRAKNSLINVSLEAEKLPAAFPRLNSAITTATGGKTAGVPLHAGRGTECSSWSSTARL